VTLKDYELLSRPNSPYHWFCSACSESALSAVKSDNLIEEKCRQHYQALHREFSAEVSSLRDRVDKIEDGVLTDKMQQSVVKIVQKHLPKVQCERVDTADSELIKPVEKRRSDLVRESVEEVRDRDRRKTNILMFNVPESSSEKAEERIVHDKSEVDAVLEELGVKDDVNFSKPVRLTKSKNPAYADKPRPLRIRVNSEEERRKVLQAAKNMEETKKFKLKTIFMKRDMTPLERQEIARRTTPVGREKTPVASGDALDKDDR
jgi:hypothetical protein